jgi:hypothetical protein
MLQNDGGDAGAPRLGQHCRFIIGRKVANPTRGHDGSVRKDTSNAMFGTGSQAEK